MELTAENYYSPEANAEYMSVSQFKSFAGTDGKLACEAEAMAELRGEWEMKKTTALMVGSYVDSYFEGTLDDYKKRTPELFTQKGTLRAEYKKADDIIKRIERDPFFMKCMSGEKQVIMTGELFGAKWKIKMDSHVRGLLKLKNGTKSRNETHCYKLGKYIFDAEHATLRNEETDEKKSITERGAKILQLLVENKNDIVRREAILNQIWGVEDKDFFASRSLDVFVNNIRKELKDEPRVELKTVRGIGLSLIVKE